MEQTPEIDLDRFVAARATGTVIDVREPDEYAKGHVPGAHLIPMRELARRISEIPKVAPVFVICASGNRSLAMADLLRSAGFDALSVSGGTQGWIRSGHDIERGTA